MDDAGDIDRVPCRDLRPSTPVRRALAWLLGAAAAGLIFSACGGADGPVLEMAETGRITENVEVGERNEPEPTATRVAADAAAGTEERGTAIDPALDSDREAAAQDVAAEDASAVGTVRDDEPTVDPNADLPLRYDAPGPYVAGVLTISLGDREMEVWYPVDPGATAGLSSEVFDSLSVFPENLQALIPPELSGETDTGAFRNAPAAEGTWPLVIYGHGFGGYRQVATAYTTHLASWGYVVASADHLERGIREQSLDVIGAGEFDETNQRPDAAVDDVRAMIESMELATADTAGPLAGRIDMRRIGITGHSAGAWAAVASAVALPDAIDTWISIAGGAGDAPPEQPGLVVIAELDEVVVPDRSYELFDQVVSRTILVNIAGAGHNSFTDSCQGIRDLGGLSSLAGLIGDAQVARAEDGCIDRFLEPGIAQALLNHVSVAHLRAEFDEALRPESLGRDTIESVSALSDYQVGPRR